MVKTVGDILDDMKNDSDAFFSSIDNMFKDFHKNDVIRKQEIDSFLADYFYDNAELQSEFDSDELEANKDEIYRLWKKYINNGENEWVAAEQAANDVLGKPFNYEPYMEETLRIAGCKPLNELQEPTDDYDYSADYDAENSEECAWCGETYPKSEMKHEKDLGWVCYHCAKGLESKGEELEFDEE